jgi:hypothetical protein
VDNQWTRVQKSTTKYDKTDPIWNEDFYFRINTTTNNALYVQVWDRDVPPPNQQFIGGFTVLNNALPPSGVGSFDVGNGGKLFLKLKFFPDQEI